MSARALSAAAMQQAVNTVAEFGTVSAAAKKLGISRNTLQSRVDAARRAGVAPSVDGLSADVLSAHERLALSDRVRELELLLKSERRERLSEDRVRQELFGLAREAVSTPNWAVQPMKKHDRPGIPSLFLSDLHWGEVVLPGQIHNKNEFNVSVAKKRLQRVISRTIGLCFEHMTHPEYPGIVVNLGGDLVSGDIHEELAETNELTSGQTLIDIVGALIWALDRLVERFGRVWVVAVAGNHGRMTKKPRMKQRAFTNFDWVIAQLLRRHYQDDDRLSWLVPDGPDAWYRVFGHRYLLTHGDQFRGGDGIIGLLGPVTRGDVRKRARNGDIDLSYDTLLLGHWHQYTPLPHLIVNGSLKGYDEYAMMNNFRFQVPIQALWFTHPAKGITSHWPIFCEEPRTRFSGATVQLGEMP